MNVEYSKGFEKSVRKLSGKMLDSVRRAITIQKTKRRPRSGTTHCIRIQRG